MKTRRVSLRQLVVSLVVANCVYLVFTLGLMTYHRLSNASATRRAVDEISSTVARDKVSYADATRRFVKEHEWPGFEVRCLDERGDLLYESSGFRAMAPLDSATLSSIPEGGTHHVMGVRIH